MSSITVKFRAGPLDGQTRQMEPDKYGKAPAEWKCKQITGDAVKTVIVRPGQVLTDGSAVELTYRLQKDGKTYVLA